MPTNYNLEEFETWLREKKPSVLPIAEHIANYPQGSFDDYLSKVIAGAFTPQADFKQALLEWKAEVDNNSLERERERERAKWTN